MEIVRGLEYLKKRYERTILTIGTFDGLHLGHQTIIKRVKRRAQRLKGTSVVFTFNSHPRQTVGVRRPPLLLPLDKKVELIQALGIDVLILVNFTKKFAQTKAEDFVREILWKKLRVKEIYVGFDYAFGRGRKGGVMLLSEMGRDLGFKVRVVKPVKINNVIISSTKIRELIKQGAVEEAALMLGRPYTIEGRVVSGSGRGQLLGFPTANLRSDNELLPPNGVYAARVKVNNGEHKGVVNIGYRPTFGEGLHCLEVHIMDFQDEIYGKKIEVAFIKRLRKERTFRRGEELARQIKEDVERAKGVLNNRR